MSQVQAVKGANNAASTTITFSPASTTAGNQLLIFIFSSSNITLSSVSTGSWATRTAAAQKTLIIDNLSCAGGITSITVTVNTADFMLGCLIERNDISGFDQCVAQATQSGVTTWTSTTSAAMAQSREIGYGFAGSFNGGGGSLTGAGVGWTGITGTSITAGNIDDASGNAGFIESQLFSAGGTTAATGTCTSIANPLDELVLYKLATAPGIAFTQTNPGRSPARQFRVFQQGVPSIPAQDPFAAPILATNNHPGRGAGKRPFPQFTQGVVPAAVGSVDASSATTDGADVLAANVAPVVDASSATTDGADVLAANVAPIVAASSATTDGADVLAANVAPVVGVTSATTDGADVLAAAVAPIVAVSSATTDGADVLASAVAPIVAVSSATTDGADVLAATVAGAIDASVAGTDGADSLSANVDSGQGEAEPARGGGGFRGARKKRLVPPPKIPEVEVEFRIVPEYEEAPPQPITRDFPNPFETIQMPPVKWPEPQVQNKQVAKDKKRRDDDDDLLLNY